MVRIFLLQQHQRKSIVKRAYESAFERRRGEGPSPPMLIGLLPSPHICEKLHMKACDFETIIILVQFVSRKDDLGSGSPRPLNSCDVWKLNKCYYYMGDILCISSYGVSFVYSTSKVLKKIIKKCRCRVWYILRPWKIQDETRLHLQYIKREIRHGCLSIYIFQIRSSFILKCRMPIEYVIPYIYQVFGKKKIQNF